MSLIQTDLLILFYNDIINTILILGEKYMLIGFAGVTGIGKSHFKDKLVEKLGFEKIKIITTREMRKRREK